MKAPGPGPAPAAGAGDEVTLDARLRMVPADPAAYRRAHHRARAELAQAREAGTVTAALLRRVGVGFLVLRELDAAAELLTEAVALADTPRRRVAALVNLGDARRYAEDYPPAREHYLQALRLAREQCPEVADFALQHLGKLHTDLGAYAQAEETLREALALRRAKAAPDLIASTEQALTHCAAARAAGGQDPRPGP